MSIFDLANIQTLVNNKPFIADKIAATVGRSWLSYILRLVKKDYTLVIPGQKEIEATSADSVVISPMFFRDFVCKNCGNCCSKIDTFLFFTKPEIKNNNINETDLKTLGFEKILIGITSKDDKSKGWLRSINATKWNISRKGKCIWLDKDKHCRIHSSKPVQCILSPIYIDKYTRKKNARGAKGPLITMRLTKRLIGRNWLFGCKMEKEKMTPQVLSRDIRKLELLLSIAEYLKIETWLPEIIDRLKPCTDSEHVIWSSVVDTSVVIKPIREEIIK